MSGYVLCGVWGISSGEREKVSRQCQYMISDKRVFW